VGTDLKSLRNDRGENGNNRGENEDDCARYPVNLAKCFASNSMD
jgi:hypothetical protein